MGRPSSIAGTGIQPLVDELLDAGVSYAEVSTRTGASLPAVGRYALSRKSQLAKIVDGQPNVTDVVARLVEAADHARDARRHARLVGSPVHQARAIKAETEVLSKIIAELGITDTTVVELADEAYAFAQAVGTFADGHPERARALIATMRTYPALHDVTAAFARRIESKS